MCVNYKCVGNVILSVLRFFKIYYWENGNKNIIIVEEEKEFDELFEEMKDCWYLRISGFEEMKI